LYGRITNGLTPWRKRGAQIKAEFLFTGKPVIFSYWSEKWRSAEDWLKDIERNILKTKTRVRRGDSFADWDIEVRNGLFARCRALLAIEEHGMGKQFLKLKCKTRYSVTPIIIVSIFFVFSVWAAFSNHWIIAGLTGLTLLALSINLFASSARAMNNLYSAMNSLNSEKETEKIIEFINKNKKSEERTSEIETGHSFAVEHHSLKGNLDISGK
jgi:hypothetical protein